MTTMRKSAAVLTIATFMLAGMAISANAKKGGNTTQRNRVFNDAIVDTVIGSVNVTDNTIAASIKGVPYTVNVSSTTKIVRRYNGRVDGLSEIMGGDHLKIWGIVDSTNPGFISATRIRDNSIKKLGASFQGIIKDLRNRSNLTNSSIIVTTKRSGDQTVNVPANFALRPYKGISKTVADLNVNDQIIVKGIWNTNTDTIYDVTWIKIKRLAPTTP